MESALTFIAPLFIFLALSGFIKIFSVLSITRVGMGLSGGGYTLIVGVLSFSLALIGTMKATEAPTISALFKEPMLEEKLLPFAQKRLTPESSSFAQEVVPSGEERTNSRSITVTSVVLEDLRQAFRMSLSLLIPFVVIDLLTLHLLASLGVSQLSPELVSFPLKLLVFTLLDGWALLSARLLIGG